MRNRYYNQQLKSFINIDPVEYWVNWYSYLGGNPVNFIDPLGLWNQRDYPKEYEPGISNNSRTVIPAEEYNKYTSTTTSVKTKRDYI